LMFIIVT